jgi:hypothetical protein
VAKAEGQLRESGLRIAQTTLAESLGNSCIKVLRLLLKGKVTWADIETHHSAVTVQQWRRIRALLYERTRIVRVARQEGRAAGARTKTIRLSIGRGCTMLLNSMLASSVVITHDLASAIDQQLEVMKSSDESTEVLPVETESTKRVMPPGRSKKMHSAKRRRVKRPAQPEKRWLPIGDRLASSGAREDSSAGSGGCEGVLALALRAALQAPRRTERLAPATLPKNRQLVASRAPAENSWQPSALESVQDREPEGALAVAPRSALASCI